MIDRRDYTIPNIEREPETRIYTDGSSGGSALLAGVIIALLLIGLFALVLFRPADTTTTIVPSVPAIEAPAPAQPTPAPAPEQVNPAPEAPAPALP